MTGVPRGETPPEASRLLQGRRLLFVVNDPLFFLSHRLPLARAARLAQLDVHVATPPDAGWERITAEGFAFHPVHMSRWGSNPLSETAAVLRLSRLYRRLLPDIVHHVTIKPVLYGSMAARIGRVPAVINAVTGLGQVFSSRGAAAGARRALVLLLYRAAMAGHYRIITQNPDDRALFMSAGVVPAEQVVLIPGSGVDPRRFRPVPEPPGVPVVLFAARLLAEKGVREFAAAARRIHQSGIAARFVLAPVPADGNPGLVPAHELAAWQRDGVVELLEHQRDMAALLARSHIVCLPSYYGEGVPKILIEAASAGRAIVTTDWPGCREIVHHEYNGLLVPPRDNAALAAALERLLNDSLLRARLGRQGRQLVLARGYTEAAVVERTLRLYAECLAECAPRIAARAG